jgi:phospholipase/carboxylesterase
MLRYEILPPTAANATGSHHCLILHGLGDNHTGWMPVVPMLALPELGFALPDAPIPYGPGWSWFDIHPDWSIDDEQVRASRRLLGELIGKLLTQLRIGTEQLHLMGFSQGSLMVLDTALRWPTRFAGVVGISGFMTMLDEYPAAFGAAARSQRILMTHGRHDGMIPIAGVRRQKDALLGLGLNVQWREYDKDHGLDPGDELRDIRRFLREGLGQASAAAPKPGR